MDLSQVTDVIESAVKHMETIEDPLERAKFCQDLHTALGNHKQLLLNARDAAVLTCRIDKDMTLVRITDYLGVHKTTLSARRKVVGMDGEMISRRARP